MTMKRMTKLERDVAMHLAVHLQPGSLIASRAAGRAKRCAAAVRSSIGSLELGRGTVPWGPVDARQQLVAVGRLWPGLRFRGHHRQQPFNPLGVERPILESTSSDSRPRPSFRHFGNGSAESKHALQSLPLSAASDCARGA